MQIDRHVERFGARIDRPEPLVVEEHAVGEAVQHGAFEAELDGAFELVGGRLRDRGRQGGKGGKTRIAGDDGVQPVVDAAGQGGRGVGGQLLRRRRAVRDHLNVDAGLIHFLDADRVEIVQPLELLAGPAGLAAAIGLGELVVPIMLLDGDDGTMRFLEHRSSPVVFC